MTTRCLSDDERRQTRRLESAAVLIRAVAHDFNNLMSIILGYSELMALSFGPDDPRLLDLEAINTAGNRAVDLNRQILAFSHDQVGPPEMLDLNEMILGMQPLLHHVMGEQVGIVLRLEPGLGKLMAERGDLEHVLLHLVMNARESMLTGGTLTLESANVEVSAREANIGSGQSAGPHVMLAVGDTGVDVDRSTEKALAVRFSRAGTYPELSSVSRIVTECGGTISVSCERGRGTVLRLLFPVAQANSTDVVPGLFTHSKDGNGGSETILLVEDDEQVRIVVEKILTGLGYEILAAQSAGDALLVSEQHIGTIDLLLSDVVMPRMSGRDLALRLSTSRPAMRASFMSGYTEAADETTDANGAKVLRKPFTSERLAQHVRQALGASSAYL